MLSPFPELHRLHSVRSFAGCVAPPLDHGTTWSISSRQRRSKAGELPQAAQRKPSRCMILKRSEIGTCRRPCAAAGLGDEVDRKSVV